MNQYQCLSNNEPVAIYPLSMSRDYVRHWTFPEAIREIIQNAIDSDSPFEYEFEANNILTITSRKASLDPSTLVLGSTSKAEDSSKIGSFGEGYKIALLVLARLGYNVYVMNNGRLWEPVFKFNEQFGVEMLYIEEHQNSCTGLTFVVGGLSPEDKQKVIDSCLHMQPTIADAIDLPQGRILPSSPGKLYVNGLYVCDTKMKHGYDIKPDYISLERDRQTVSSFQLAWLVKDMWFATQQFEKVADMITKDFPDMEYANHGCPELLKEAVYQQFMKNNPGGVVASSPEHLKELVNRGMSRAVYVNSNTHAIVSTSKSYAVTAAAVAKPTPLMVLNKWYEENEKNLRRLPKVGFKALLKMAEQWQNK